MKRHIIGFLLGVTLATVANQAFFPRQVITYSGKNKNKGDGNVITNVNVEKLREQWEKECEERLKEAEKTTRKERRKQKRER